MRTCSKTVTYNQLCMPPLLQVPAFNQCARSFFKNSKVNKLLHNKRSNVALYLEELSTCELFCIDVLSNHKNHRDCFRYVYFAQVICLKRNIEKEKSK